MRRLEREPDPPNTATSSLAGLKRILCKYFSKKWEAGKIANVLARVLAPKIGFWDQPLSTFFN